VVAANLNSPGNGVNSYTPGETMNFSDGTGEVGQMTVFTTKAISATIATAGSGGTDGVYTFKQGYTGYPGTTGYGLPYELTVTVSGGAVTDIDIAEGGEYEVNPTSLTAVPITGIPGLVDATTDIVMGVGRSYISRQGNYPTALIPSGATATGSLGGQGASYILTVRTPGQWAYGTDDYATIQAEINTLGTAKGGVLAISPEKQGMCAITAGLVDNNDNVTLKGLGWGLGSNTTFTVLSRIGIGTSGNGAGTALVYFGPRGGTMYTREPGIGATRGVKGGGIDGIVLAGLSSAGRNGVVFAQQGGGYTIYGENVLTRSFEFGASAPLADDVSNTSFVNFKAIESYNQSSSDVANADGVVFSGKEQNDFSANHIIRIRGVSQNFPFVDFRYADGNTVDQVNGVGGCRARGFGVGYGGPSKFNNVHNVSCDVITGHDGSGPDFWDISVDHNSTPQPTIESGSRFFWQSTGAVQVSTVAQLPPCNSSLTYQEQWVSDALQPIAGRALQGAGALKIKAWCDGTIWRGRSSHVPFGWVSNSISAGTTTRIRPGNTTAVSGAPTDVAGRFSGLNVTLTTAPGAGQSVIATGLVNNNTASALTCTIADAATSCSDLVNTAAHTSGTWSIQIVTSAGAAATGTIYAGVGFDGP
jgi:hypothetical protein